MLLTLSFTVHYRIKNQDQVYGRQKFCLLRPLALESAAHWHQNRAFMFSLSASPENTPLWCLICSPGEVPFHLSAQSPRFPPHTPAPRDSISGEMRYITHSHSDQHLKVGLSVRIYQCRLLSNMQVAKRIFTSSSQSAQKLQNESHDRKCPWLTWVKEAGRCLKSTCSMFPSKGRDAGPGGKRLHFFLRFMKSNSRTKIARKIPSIVKLCEEDSSDDREENSSMFVLRSASFSLTLFLSSLFRSPSVLIWLSSIWAASSKCICYLIASQHGKTRRGNVVWLMLFNGMHLYCSTSCKGGVVSDDIL